VITLTLNKPVGFNDDGTEKTERKTYICPVLKGRAAMVAFELRDKLNLEKVEDIDFDTAKRMILFVVDLFGKQFTEDELLDGLTFKELMPTVLECLTAVLKGVDAKLGAIPNGQTE